MTVSPSEQKFLDKVRSFAAGSVAQGAPGWSMGEDPGAALYAQAGALGITGTCVPVEHGGQGMGFATLARMCETLAAVDFGFAMSLVNTQNVALRISQSASPRLSALYLPPLISGDISACTALTEPGAGSDFAAITTRAEHADNGWVLNGEKTWIVNGRHAGLAVVFAQCGAPGDAAGIGGFLVDLNAPGATRYPISSGFSQSSMGTGGFTLENVALAEDRLILPPGDAFKSVLIEINAARTYVAAMCNAMLEAALSASAEFGARRHSFGKPLDQHPDWIALLDKARAALEQSSTQTGAAIALVDQGRDAQLAAAQAKIMATEACQRYLPDLLHAMGAEGLRPEHCFTRHLAAAQMAGLADGATTILRQRVAKLTRNRDDQPET